METVNSNKSEIFVDFFSLALSRLATTQQRLQLGKVRSTLVKLPFTVTYPFKAGESEVGFSGGWLAGELDG